MVYLITYDLNAPGKNYTALYNALKTYDYIRDPGLDSVWFVSTSRSAGEVYDHLRDYIDRSDKIIISEVHADTYEGWLHKDVWTWINSRL